MCKEPLCCRVHEGKNDSTYESGMHWWSRYCGVEFYRLILFTFTSWILFFSASKWGEYTCDVPMSTFQALLNHIKTISPPPGILLRFGVKVRLFWESTRYAGLWNSTRTRYILLCKKMITTTNSDAIVVTGDNPPHDVWAESKDGNTHTHTHTLSLSLSTLIDNKEFNILHSLQASLHE